MINKKSGLIALLAAVALSDVMASNNLTNYVAGSGDVLICFRKGSDMVVDAGPLSTFTNLSANQRITITAYTTAQLTEAVGNYNAMWWSAFTWLNDDTLYVSKPRINASLNKQTTPWTPATGASQASVINRMNKVVQGSQDEFSFDALSSPTAVITEDASIGNPNFATGMSYKDAIFGAGSTANFFTTFEGVPENAVTNNFTSKAKVVRSDFYQLSPNALSGVWLGYFELNTNGVMSYVAYPSTTPVITSITRSGNQTTINYTTGLYGTYTLRNATVLNGGVAPLSWSSVSTLASGDTAIHAITFTDNNASSFYLITAQ